MTITQGLLGAVSEYCLGRRDAADGGAAAAVVVGAVVDGDEADELAGDAADAGAAGEAAPLVVAGEPLEADPDPDGTGEAAPEAAGDAVPEASEVVPDASGAGPGVQAARADRPAPAISSRATARRLGRSPGRATAGRASAEGSEEQL
ncbi:hypothetical protein [Arthrobacter globiformis]|uniref:hypothetical protein n=1 Tax=Arthrobacter globiformis TaxID=1665 RepID=UPI0011B93EC6